MLAVAQPLTKTEIATTQQRVRMAEPLRHSGWEEEDSNSRCNAPLTAITGTPFVVLLGSEPGGRTDRGLTAQS